MIKMLVEIDSKGEYNEASSENEESYWKPERFISWESRVKVILDMN